MLTYTLRSEETGRLYTFEARVEHIVREVKFMVECGFVLDGVDGLDGYKSPAPVPFFAHAFPSLETLSRNLDQFFTRR